MSDETRTTERKCPICGRWMARVMRFDPDAGRPREISRQCVKVMASGDGNYEHD